MGAEDFKLEVVENTQERQPVTLEDSYSHLELQPQTVEQENDLAKYYQQALTALLRVKNGEAQISEVAGDLDPYIEHLMSIVDLYQGERFDRMEQALRIHISLSRLYHEAGMEDLALERVNMVFEEMRQYPDDVFDHLTLFIDQLCALETRLLDFVESKN